ncbi:MAG TPA: LysE family transporter [Puia sp.]|jgi:threonine/homoserine/homoserine lactone efflux protein|nr:LysE family transporter [Puia sp.]
MQYTLIILLGLILSLLGQLPLGTISMTATQIAVQENFRNAWKYSAGIALVEMIYLRIVLSGMQWIISHQLVFLIFNWITIALFAALGIIILIAAQKQEKQKKALLLNYPLDRFLLGLSMSALNPAQIPFWFIWTGYFINLGWLKPGFAEFNLFTLGTGVGTMAGLLIYIYGGNWLVTKMKTSNRTLNKLMGIIFIIAAAAQLYRVLRP